MLRNTAGSAVPLHPPRLVSKAKELLWSPILYPLCQTVHELEATRQENIYQRLIAETLLQNPPSKRDVCTPEVTYNAK